MAYDFNSPNIISGLPEIGYNICQNVVLFLIDLMIVKPFSFKFCRIVSIFLGIYANFLHEKMCSAQKISLPIRASEN